MVQYTNEEKYDMLIIYGECRENARAAVRLYSARFPNRRCPDKKTFLELKKNLLQYGSFNVAKRKRLNTVTNDETTAEVLQHVENNPQTSIRNISEATNISITSCHRILSRNKFHPYKAHIVHHLRPEDPERRLDFLSRFSVLYQDDNNILKKILWTDESRFHNNGVVNRHNCHYWSDNNPRWTKETGNQNKFGINVWCGILDGHLIGPLFFEGQLTGERYLHFLQNDILNLLEAVPVATRRDMWWQQDGAPAHNAQIVAEHLNTSYPGKWIGTNGPIRWPARAPDLSPPDFFYGGH